MPDWFKLNLGDPLLADDVLEQIREQFQLECQASVHGDDMAVYFRHEQDRGLHCEVMVYFSPASAAVAKRFAAVPCGVPALQGLDLLVDCQSS